MEKIRLLPLLVQETFLLPIKRSDLKGMAIRIRPDEFVFLACCNIIEMLILMDVVHGREPRPMGDLHGPAPHVPCFLDLPGAGLLRGGLLFQWA
ncbi:hypothetical protein CDL15_Pgr020501 [Punica granatum]|uniref:Uncharacterized protein n=1 Tax=Punica granatum TaxID=22663 RepID=A0A218VVF1_PUNGR|nr:hypothetical protein CDL15_Pgr020501 [Punica granatum]PKI32973.1 hypothetical protein CRG98_046647 [Punica granatum]